MEQLHAIRAGKMLLCRLSVLMVLVAVSPAQELNRHVGDPIDVSVDAGVHPEVNAGVTGQPAADSTATTHRGSSFGPVRNQAASSKPASATPAASVTGSRTASPAQLRSEPMPPLFTAVPSSNKLSRGATPAAPAQKKHLALASGGEGPTHSHLESAASNSDSSKLNPSISSARLPRKTRKQRTASAASLSAKNRHTLGGSSSKGAAHSSATLPKPTLAK